MNPDANLQVALAQLSEIHFWELNDNDLRSRLIAVARKHQAAPVLCAECGKPFPCDTNLLVRRERPPT